jgi:hypothetical protein
MSEPAGPIVLWEDYGCEGWQPKSFATVTEALMAPRYSASFVITMIVKPVDAHCPGCGPHPFAGIRDESCMSDPRCTRRSWS